MSSSQSNATTIYEVLSEHKLSIGLFPKGVKEFAAGKDDSFYDTKFKNELHYKQNISRQLNCDMIDTLTNL
ncbi:hypothetical protein E2542_SST28294 [Spatholobus suberectus]|nr:hypothetical protein E2542_SST28294 [Spatholobus suberectus]